MSEDSLINKWRPEKWEHVVGHKTVVTSIRRVLDDKNSHAFLLTGPRGCGKTSIARLGAKHVGTSPQNIIDVDAATFSKIEDMRSLTASLDYKPLMVAGKQTGVKSLIIDECHRLSPNAWDSLLKRIEEPPNWVFWFLCTTDPSKVPKTIASRCSAYNLTFLPKTTITEFLEDVCHWEKWETPAAVIELCARMSEGSPREALSKLSVCYGAVDRKEAAELIANQEDEKSELGIELARSLSKGDSWEIIRPLLAGIKENGENTEGIRHIVSEYFSTVLFNAKEPKAAINAVKILEAFSEPFDSSMPYASLGLAVGRAVFSK